MAGIIADKSDKQEIIVDESLIKKVAGIARLELTDDEIKKFIPQFKEILSAFSQIKSVNTSGVDVSLHSVSLIRNRMREDKTKPCLSQEEALSQTEHKKDGYFKGPRII